VTAVSSKYSLRLRPAGPPTHEELRQRMLASNKPRDPTTMWEKLREQTSRVGLVCGQTSVDAANRQSNLLLVLRQVSENSLWCLHSQCQHHKSLSSHL